MSHIFKFFFFKIVVTIYLCVVNVTVLRCVICRNCRSCRQGDFLQYHWIIYHV